MRSNRYVQSARGCGTRNIAQTYRYIVYLDVFSLIISLVQFVQGIDKFGDQPGALAIGLLVLLISGTQLLIGGRSLRQRRPDERGIFSKYYLYLKLAYLVIFIAFNTIVPFHFCKTDPELEDSHSCNLSPIEIIIFVIWILVQVYSLQIVLIVWKRLKTEGRVQRPTETQNPLQEDVNQIIVNIEEVFELIAGIKRFPNPKVVEVKGFSYTPEDTDDPMTVKDIPKSISLSPKKKTATPSKNTCQKLQQVNLIQTIIDYHE